MLDEELRDQLADWAHGADRLPVPDIAVLRGRVRRRRLRAGGTIAGVAVITATAAVAGTLLAAPSVRPNKPPVAWYPAGPLPPADAGPEAAPYFITLAARRHGPVTVTDWRSGKHVAHVWPPTRMGTFVGVAAAADDRTFVLEEDGSNIEPLTPERSGIASGAWAISPIAFYELRLRPDGHPLPLTRLAIPAATMAKVRSAATPNPIFGIMTNRVVQGLTSYFAISPDGRNLAVVVATGGRRAIDVVSLPTGRVQEWNIRVLAWPPGLAWAGDRYLTFPWLSNGSMSLSVLDTAAHSAPRVIVRPIAHIKGIGRGWIKPSLVSPDGSTLFAAYYGPTKVALIQISLRTGDFVRELLPPVPHQVSGPFCEVLWSDPSGRRVAAACGNEQGIVSDGKFRRLSLNLPVYAPFPRTGDWIEW